MGANAQIEVPAFTAGQILTAAEMTQINTGIPVFATTVTRDAAFGGAGEKVLAEGQFAYIEATNTTQYYDGSAWVAVGVAPGLVCVKAQTPFTAVSSITADNVFTASYTNYKIVVNYTTSTNNDIFLKLRVGGVSASTNYNRVYLQGNASSAAVASSTGQTSMLIGVNSATLNGSTIIELHRPAEATATMITAINNMPTGGAYTSPAIWNFGNNHSTATAYDGVELLVTGGSTTGTYTIYGYGITV
tara:strand:+ start:80 stop:817 length:738 start_codon:yes stop_codon:yes gene_type:complete